MDDYWMFKVGKDGEVMLKLFNTKKLPKGWSDSPKAARAAVEAKKLEKKLGKSNDDSSGFNKLFS